MGFERLYLSVYLLVSDPEQPLGFPEGLTFRFDQGVKEEDEPWPGAQWDGASSRYPKVEGWTPSQGTCCPPTSRQ